MNNQKIKKISISGVLCALAVVGSMFSIPVFGSKCAPVQHIINVLSGVVLGPIYSVGIAFTASLIRNLLGLGSLMAFPGSMFGAFLCGIVYKKYKNISLALVGEVLGTSILGGLTAYPIAILFMGKVAGELAFYAYVFPFFVSTFVGAIIAFFILMALKKTNLIDKAVKQ